jgi:hypothetical protein
MSLLNTTINTRTITVNLANNGAFVGDYIEISGVNSSVGGVPASELNGDHIVTTTALNSFTFEVATLASSSAGYDGPMTLLFDIHAGVAVASYGYGWGAGNWGRGAWGSASTIPAYTPPRLYSQDRFDSDLILCIRYGDIYYWEYNNNLSNRAVPLYARPSASDVPLIVSSILISQQDRHLFAFGCTAYATNQYDPLLVRWSSAGAPEWWTPGTVTVPTTGQLSSAGFLRLGNGSEIIEAIRTREEILVFTDSSLYSLRNVGGVDIFLSFELADNISIISPACLATVNNITFWMGVDKFYVYNGRVDTLPCTLRQHIFSNINRQNQIQIVCGTNEQFSEIIWFYPTGTSIEPNSYVIYNYLEQIWYYGELERTAWMDSPLRPLPQAMNTAGWVYNQEDGVDADGAPLEAYISSGDIDIEDGEQFMLIRRIIPDINFVGSTATNPQVKLTVQPHNFPGQLYATDNLEGTGLTKTVTASRNQATAIIDQYTNQVFLRARGRQIKYKIASDGLGVQWQMGMPRIDARPDGKRG